MANRAVIMGRLGSDPIVRYLASGMAIAEFSVATNEYYKGKAKTSWHNMVAWGKTAELCSKYLKKGMQAYFEGRIAYSEWEKDGVKHNRTQIQVEKLEFISDGTRQASEPSEDFHF